MMVRWVGVFAIVLLSAPGMSAYGQTADTPTLAPAVVSCTDRNAPDVERAIPSLKDAMDFIVDSVCAAPLADEARQRQQAQTRHVLEQAQKDCDASKAAPNGVSRKIDDVDTVDPCQTLASLKSATDQIFTGGWVLYGALNNKDPYAASYAAKVLLQLRLAHMSRDQRGAQ